MAQSEHEIEILTIASTVASRGSALSTYTPPNDTWRRLAERGLLRVTMAPRYHIDRKTGRAVVYEDILYEPTWQGEDAVERAIASGELSVETMLLLTER